MDNSLELNRLNNDLILCESQILHGKWLINSSEIQKKIINQKIQELKSVREVQEIIYTDDGETMLLAKNNKNSKINSDLPGEIKDTKMQKRGIPYKFLLDDIPVEEILDNFPDIGFVKNGLNRDQFMNCLNNKEMTIKRLSELIGIDIEYNFGDFINFGDYRYCSMYIVGHAGILYPNPDNSASGGISIPIEISRYLYDAVDKYGDCANDIDIGFDDDILSKYNVTGEMKNKGKFYWTDETLYYETADDVIDLGESLNKNLIVCESTDSVSSEDIIDSKSSHDNINLNGKSIVFTGGKDKELLDLISLNNLDIKIGSSISKNTFGLIAKNKDDNSTKITKAKELKIPIYSPNEFKILINKVSKNNSVESI